MSNKYILFFLFFTLFIFKIQAQENTFSGLDSLILKKRNHNKTTKRGFRIQLYNGNEETTIEKIDKFKEDFPDIKVYMIYKIPEWKIRTEIYKTRLEADRILNIIKEKYPGARVL